jgi:RNA polymerase sigma-70 factor, ECF subfamily
MTGSNYPGLKDNKLVQMAREGDDSAFEELVGRHYSRCIAVATLILHDRTEAQDQVQRAMYKAYTHLNQFQGSAEFSSWMVRIVENECLMVLRVQRRAKHIYLDNVTDNERASLDLPANAVDAEHEIIKQELAGVVRREMKRLPPLLRQVITLRDIDELPMPEVASRLGVTIAAAKSRLLRARFELRMRATVHSGENGIRMSPSVVRHLPARHAQSLAHAV